MALGPWHFKSEHQLVWAIRELSEVLTSKREKLPDYWDDPKLLAAYVAFYLPTNYPKFFYLLQQTAGLIEELKAAQFVDVGSGPGTYLLAFLDFVEGRPKSTPIAIESSMSMRQLAGQLLTHYHPQVSVEMLEDFKAQKLEGPVWLNFGHSLNEMGADRAWEIIEQLQPEWVFVIEPGTPLAFREMLKLRQWLFGHDYHAHFPCPSSQSLCPLADSDNWCHQMLFTHFHPELERLFQLAKKDRLHMPILAHAYAKAAPAHPFKEGQGRLLQVVAETKFGLEIDVCMKQMGDNHQEHLLLMKKKHSKKLIKRLKAAPLGESITFEKIRPLPQGQEAIVDEKEDDT